MFNVECNYQTIISKENNFIAKVKENEIFSVDTINAFGDKFNNIDELMELINCKDGKTHHHPLTGPINIEGAKKGDVLKVHIHKIEVYEMAQSLSKSAGIDPIRDSSFESRSLVIGEKNKDEIKFIDNIKLKLKPLIGIIATTPEEDFIKTGHAKVKNGGNLDIPFITENTDIYIPVEIDGAGLYLGDVHSTQGYGELSGIALEASSKVTLEVQILKPRETMENILVIGKEPFSDKECIGVVGVGEKMNLEKSIYDAFNGSEKILGQLLPSLNKNVIKELITLTGNSFNGQAFAKTSESTSIIIMTKDNISRLTNCEYKNFTKEIEKSLFLNWR